MLCWGTHAVSIRVRMMSGGDGGNLVFGLGPQSLQNLQSRVTMAGQ